MLRRLLRRLLRRSFQVADRLSINRVRPRLWLLQVAANLLLLVVLVIWWMFDWYSISGTYIADLLAMLGMVGLTSIPWLRQLHRWQRLLSTPMPAILLLCLLATSPMGVELADRGLWQWVGPDSGEKADAIVVLGTGESTLLPRVRVALDLWRSQRAPRLLASGIGDAPQMMELWQAKGVSPRAITGETCSRNTRENALFTEAILQPQGVRRILLVTDLPQMPRSLLIFRSYTHFQIIPHVSPLPGDFSPTDQGRWLMRGYLGLLLHTIQTQIRSAPEIAKLPDVSCRMTP